MLTEEEKAKLLEDGKSEAEISQMEQLAELKEKMDQMVDPEKFAKLKEDYDKLLNEYVNKRPAPKKEKPTFRPTKEIANELRNVGDGDATNRDYIKKSLEYRQAHINEFGTDPWTNFGSNGPEAPNAETNKVAEVLQRLVDENDSPSSFRIALDGTLKDNQQLLTKLKRRK